MNCWRLFAYGNGQSVKYKISYYCFVPITTLLSLPYLEKKNVLSCLYILLDFHIHLPQNIPIETDINNSFWLRPQTRILVCSRNGSLTAPSLDHLSFSSVSLGENPGPSLLHLLCQAKSAGQRE